MLVTVLTPCFNSGRTVEKTLECIESQTYKNIEYIIVDGGSTDNTLELIERHRGRLPERTIVISEKDNGIYDAMNKGIRLAKGHLIGIVNSDDYYEKDTVEQIVKHFGKNRYEVVYGMQRIYLDDKEKAFCLNKSIWTQTTKEKGQTSWHGDSVGSIETTDIKIIDGFILTGKENYVIDYNRPNDTNIDLNCFFDCIGGSGTFTMTEWGISRRKYFIDRSMLSLYQSGCFRDAFHYDDKDNLIGFERICPDAKYCEWSVKIKYVY